MGTPILWIGFLAGVLALVVIDLTMVKAKGGSVSVKSAGIWVGVYVALSLGFAGFLYTLGGMKAAGTFLTVYVIEYALSVDNLFVFLVIFSYFKIQKEAQHRLLYWGVIGAFAMRALMIGLGAELVTRFSFILYGFGVFLLYTAFKLITAGEDTEVDPEKNVMLKFARKILPVAKEDHGNHFFSTENGKKVVTPLFLVLLVVETSDVLFALDSIPAALGISQDAYIIFTANACAVMGLRSLFFVVSKLMDSFHYLKIGLGLILGFVGVKLIVETAFKEQLHAYEGMLIVGSLGFIALTLAVSIVWSILWPPKKEALSEPLLHHKNPPPSQ